MTEAQLSKALFDILRAADTGQLSGSVFEAGDLINCIGPLGIKSLRIWYNEQSRKEQEKELEKKERAELARLKAKYEKEVLVQSEPEETPAPNGLDDEIDFDFGDILNPTDDKLKLLSNRPAKRQWNLDVNQNYGTETRFS